MTVVSLSAVEVRALVPMPALVTRLREALVEAETGAFECPTRHSFGDGLGLVMPAYHRPSGATVTKCLSLTSERDPAITGCAVWTSPASATTVVADAGAVTSLRTGAIVGVATALFAAPDASRLVLIGAGAQAGDQVRGVLAVRPIAAVTLVNRSSARAAALGAALRDEWPGVEFAVSDDPAAVAGADVVCCATSSWVPVFSASDLPESVHVNAIGSYLPGMRELPEAVLAGADVLAVDDVDACLVEAGELIAALDHGALAASDLVSLGQALRGHVGGRRTVFKSVGTAVQDWVVLSLLAATVD